MYHKKANDGKFDKSLQRNQHELKLATKLLCDFNCGHINNRMEKRIKQSFGYTTVYQNNTNLTGRPRGNRRNIMSMAELKLATELYSTILYVVDFIHSANATSLTWEYKRSLRYDTELILCYFLCYSALRSFMKKHLIQHFNCIKTRDRKMVKIAIKPIYVHVGKNSEPCVARVAIKTDAILATCAYSMLFTCICMRVGLR